MSKFLESRNPILKDSSIEKFNHTLDHSQDVMTVDGAVNKSLLLFGLMMLTTVLSYGMPTPFLMYTGIFGGLIAVIAAYWKPQYAHIIAPGYALFEGLFIGSISAVYNAAFDGIVLQAVGLTFGTLFAMLLIYKLKIIKVTPSFKTGILMATGAIFFVYMLSLLGHFIGFQVPFLHDAGPIGIGISVVFIAIAALNLLIDFDAFEKGAEAKAPANMEWLCALGLLVTLVWLYIEFLRLLSKLQED